MDEEKIVLEYNKYGKSLLRNQLQCKHINIFNNTYLVVLETKCDLCFIITVRSYKSQEAEDFVSSILIKIILEVKD